MTTPILATKLYIPTPRSKFVSRPHLLAQLDKGLHRKLTLISAPAGFGKTTLLCEWVATHKFPIAWLSLDENDHDPMRFLSYMIAALQTILPNFGAGIMLALQSPQKPPLENLLTLMLNELAELPSQFLLILDDYHLLDAKSIDDALAFLLDHLPPQFHLVIATREDPDLPLTRLRAYDQLTELRAGDLRFTQPEVAAFLYQTMGLDLSEENIATLEKRTEGWIVGLQLAAISMQNVHDKAAFINSFAGSHRFVLDYLLEEVLHKQTADVQAFLLQTSVLNRLCSSLCEAVLAAPAGSMHKTLDYLEQANLFILPLDKERKWYRYHHLFADLLRQRLQNAPDTNISTLHLRASQWYEDHDLDIEAFHHATAADDIARAERLIAGKGIPLHMKGAVTMILEWFASLPPETLNARPSLWWRYAALLLINGFRTGVEEKLNAAEAALQNVEPDDETRHLVGRIASARAVVALTRYQPEQMIVQSRRALEYLPQTNASTRASAFWTLGYAYIYQGDRLSARPALTEAIALSQSVGDIFTMILATIGLGNLQEAENQLILAAQTYQSVVQLAGEQPLQIVNEAHLGIARILYEWNELIGAQKFAEQSLQLAKQYDQVIDRFILSEVFLARIKLAQGDITGAVTTLAHAEQTARQRNFLFRLPDIAAAQVLVLLWQGNRTEAERLAQTYHLPFGQVRVHLAQKRFTEALVILATLRTQAEARKWGDERLKVMTLQALTCYLKKDQPSAINLLQEVLALAEPGGYVRLFVDEGLPMYQFLSETRDLMPNYVDKLLLAFDRTLLSRHAQTLPDPLSPREFEVLRLIAQGLSNDEISKRLFIARDTVKGHNRKIFEKLQVQRRTEAVARARALGLL